VLLLLWADFPMHYVYGNKRTTTRLIAVVVNDINKCFIPLIDDGRQQQLSPGRVSLKIPEKLELRASFG